MRIAVDPEALRSARGALLGSDLSWSAAIPTVVSSGAEPTVADLANLLAQEWGDEVDRLANSIKKTAEGLRSTAEALEEAEQSAIAEADRLTAAIEG